MPQLGPVRIKLLATPPEVKVEPVGELEIDLPVQSLAFRVRVDEFTIERFGDFEVSLVDVAVTNRAEADETVVRIRKESTNERYNVPSRSCVYN